MHHITYMPLSVIGDRDSTDVALVERWFRQLHAIETILLCVRMNLLTSNCRPEAIVDAQLKTLKMLVQDGYMEESIANRIFEYTQKQSDTGAVSLAINRAALLEAIRWCSIYSSSNGQQNLKAVGHLRKSFIRALLTCSWIYGEREISPTLSLTASREENEITFLKGLRRGAVWGGGFVDPLLALGRADLLVGDHFLKGFPKYNQIFQSTTGITYDDWLVCNAAVMVVGFDLTDSALHSSTLKELLDWRVSTVFESVPTMKGVFEKYLANVSQNAAELKEGFGGCKLDGDQTFIFRHLRSRPILRYEQDRAIVLDRALFVENLVHNPIFAVRMKTGDYSHLQDFGEAFHDYAFQLLSETNAGQLPDNRCPHIVNRPEGSPMPPNDIVIGTTEVCALIEAKGVWLNDDLLAETDDAKFLSAIKAKYCQESGINSEGEKIGAKGLPQLANVIKALIKKEIEVSEQATFIKSAREIFPILAVHDLLIAMPLVTKTLSKEFDRLMGVANGHEGAFQVGPVTVHRAIFLSYMDLEWLQRFEMDCSLLTLFREYSLKFPERHYAFGTFLGDRKKTFKLHPLARHLVKGRALQVLDRVGTRCFGEEYLKGLEKD